MEAQGKAKLLKRVRRGCWASIGQIGGGKELRTGFGQISYCIGALIPTILILVKFILVNLCL